MRSRKLISAILTAPFVTILLGLPALASDEDESKSDREGARSEGERATPPVGTEPPSNDEGDDTDGSTEDEKDWAPGTPRPQGRGALRLATVPPRLGIVGSPSIGRRSQLAPWWVRDS